MNKYLVLFFLLNSTFCFGAVNKWVDEQGHVHYSDQAPPKDSKAEKIHSSSDSQESGNDETATKEPTAPKSYIEKAAELKKANKAKQEAADKAAKEQANADANKANCATAQQSLRTLQEGIRMVEVDKNGERSFMDDSQRQQRIERTQQDIDKYCK